MLVKLKLGLQDDFSLGNLHAVRDWGSAGDYVRAMHLMLQHEKPDDYVIATGTSHTVRDFVETAAQVLGIDVRWTGVGFDEVGRDGNGRVIVRVDPELYRPVEVESLRGDSAKARRRLGWSPQVSSTALVDMMVKNDLERLSRRS